ncbi:hypothetical protein [Dickeya zeae]|uniref:hypothetical protein n=1 Tax=Dickeya zeae TaxID=204042 RepID=UPI0012BD5932|nr:hypothetical protein [Dickeya zeae]UJR56043.1 hypothetical protein J417_19520 [Dickeya zeae MS1]
MADATPPSYFNRYSNNKNQYPYHQSFGLPKGGDTANPPALTPVNGWRTPAT